jgi:EH domain-containing protein 1
VLNRIDECTSMIDLLRVYGTLCWNLSQITGRKDIPMIHLTFSQKDVSLNEGQPAQSYLEHLENQREDLKNAVLKAPCYRLDNLTSFVETHGERLAHFLEALISYRKRANKFNLKSFGIGTLASLAGGAAVFLMMLLAPPLAGMDIMVMTSCAAAAAVILLGLWILVFHRWLFRRFFKKTLQKLNHLTELRNQTRRDSWDSIRNLVFSHLKNTQGKYALREVRSEYSQIWKTYEKGSKEIREALRELEDLPPDKEEAFFKERLGLDPRKKEQPGLDPRDPELAQSIFDQSK